MKGNSFDIVTFSNSSNHLKPKKNLGERNPFHVFAKHLQLWGTEDVLLNPCLPHKAVTAIVPLH